MKNKQLEITQPIIINSLSTRRKKPKGELAKGTVRKDKEIVGKQNEFFGSVITRENNGSKCALGICS